MCLLPRGSQHLALLTYLDAAHVVDLGAEGQRSKNMDCREDDPEPHIIFPKHLGIKMGVSVIWGLPSELCPITIS